MMTDTQSFMGCMSESFLDSEISLEAVLKLGKFDF
jgi:hypothetical protein